MTGLPTIFVPLPHGNGEQARNATDVIEVNWSAERLRRRALTPNLNSSSDRSVKCVGMVKFAPIPHS